jgi:hypothetical protein
MSAPHALPRPPNGHRTDLALLCFLQAALAVGRRGLGDPQQGLGRLVSVCATRGAP